MVTLQFNHKKNETKEGMQGDPGSRSQDFQPPVPLTSLS